jgi:asparagine synthase (glutamine-hydrolysing)
MCGIAGFLEDRRANLIQGAEPRDRLAAMLRAIRHRGPDDWGMTFFGFQPEALVGDDGHVKRLESRDVSLALGHQRLSILDLSPNGRQPMLSKDETCCITFNGEIYNYIELREELARNIEFRTSTDTEVLLEAYRQWGIEALKRLDGMFAFALWDARAKKLICARDPLGIKPFYYAKQNGRFVFASEPRAVLAGVGSVGHVDQMRVAEFLVLGVSDHDDGTSYQEVQQLRGGHFLEVDAAGVVSEPRAFWQPPKEPERDYSDVPTLVREQITLAVHRQLRSDVPVGSCLSGGIDSGSVVATVGAILNSHASDFRTLTLTNADFDGDESDLARATARRAGVNWETVDSGMIEMSAGMEEMVRAMDEPFPSLSMLAQRQIMQRARGRGLKVMLDGQGGDEVFLGYPRVANRAVGQHFADGRISSALHEWVGLSRNASQSLANTLLNNIFFGSPALVSWRNRRRITGLVQEHFIEQARAEVAYEMYHGSQSLLDLQIGELTRFCLPQLLRFEDRNSMAYGVEARVPLLSVDLVEFALGLPLNWKVRNGWTKYALRVAMTNHLPDEIVWHRCKRGFEVPQRLWVEAARPQIARWLENLPQDFPVQGQPILDRIDAGQGGESWLWRCLSVALWTCFSGVKL